ncbi:MAG: thioredoxin family protein [Terriglobales bacterium]
MRRIRVLSVALLLVSFSAAVSAQGPANAEDILAKAKFSAVEQHKNILLVFGASWCGYCKRFQAFLDSPEIEPIIEKNFVVAHVSVEEELGKKPFLNNPGGAEMLSRFGGDSHGGIPFIVFLDPNGKLIVNSNRIAGDGTSRANKRNTNIGYPTEPEEIDWFMVMLKQAAPTLSDSDRRTVEDWLREASRDSKQNTKREPTSRWLGLKSYSNQAL